MKLGAPARDKETLRDGFLYVVHHTDPEARTVTLHDRRGNLVTMASRLCLTYDVADVRGGRDIVGQLALVARAEMYGWKICDRCGIPIERPFRFGIWESLCDGCYREVAPSGWETIR